MNLSVHWKKLSVSSSAREHLERRLSFGLGRFAQRVRAVRAVLSDENGTRGGVDKRCKLQVRTNLGMVQVAEMDRDLHAAIDLASERLQRTLARLFDRQHFQNNGSWRASGVFRRRHAGSSNDATREQLP